MTGSDKEPPLVHYLDYPTMESPQTIVVAGALVNSKYDMQQIMLNNYLDMSKWLVFHMWMDFCNESLTVHLYRIMAASHQASTYYM